MNDSIKALSRQPKYLGYMGLLPQLCILLYMGQSAERVWIGQAAGFGYAALIFSFLGGTWWGVGLMAPNVPRWLYIVAVLPSLIAFATYLPWIWSWESPKLSLVILGLGLLISPAVDRAVSQHLEILPGWLRLRLHLSVGLGLLTLAICLF